MSLIADALKRVQKTRMEQVQKPGEGRLRSILPPLDQLSSRRRFLRNRFIILGALVSLAVFAMVVARPFLPALRLRENEQTTLKDRGPGPAARHPLSISKQENHSAKPAIVREHASQASSEPEVQKPPVARQPVVASVPGRASIQPPASAEEKSHAQETGSVSAPASAESSGPFDSGQRPGTRSDLAQQITSKSKLSETIRYHYNLGVTYQKQGQLSQAKKEYEKVVQLDPLNVETHNNLGLIYKDMEELDAAMEEYQKAISIDPDHWKAHHNLGVVFYLKGDLERASAEYKLALELNPKDVGIHNNLGLSYKKQGRFSEAKEMFEKALAIYPSYPETYYNLALTMEQEGNLFAAVYNYRKFIQFSSEEHSALVEKVKNHLEKLGE